MTVYSEIWSRSDVCTPMALSFCAKTTQKIEAKRLKISNFFFISYGFLGLNIGAKIHFFQLNNKFFANKNIFFLVFVAL